jgi:hypothetical protein
MGTSHHYWLFQIAGNSKLLRSASQLLPETTQASNVTEADTKGKGLLTSRPETKRRLNRSHKVHLSPTVNADSNQLSFSAAKEPIFPTARYRLHAVITSTALWATPD